MEDSKPVNTPVDTSMKLVTANEDCEYQSRTLPVSSWESTVLIELDKTRFRDSAQSHLGNIGLRLNA